MYDLANQSFTLLVVTLLFPIYLKEVIVQDAARGDSLWSIVNATSLGLTALLGPVLGAVGDCRGQRKGWMIGLGFVCSLLTLGLGVLGPGTWALAAMVFVPANLAFQLGSNFLNSFLPSLSRGSDMGRVSAIGWTMGYVGALLLLVATIGAMFGLGLRSSATWGPFFVFAGVWYGVNMIPAIRLLREPPREKVIGDDQWIVAAAWSRLVKTVREAARFRELFRFLLAFVVFSFGVQVMVAFASLLASDFGIREVGLVVFVAQLTVTAMVTAGLTAVFQDRIGAKATVNVYLWVWLASCAAMLAVTVVRPVGAPQWLFWVIGNGIGIGLGGIGTAGRTMVGLFSPAGRTSEFFGLSGTAYNLAGAIGVLSFGQVKAWVGGWWVSIGGVGNANTPALALLVLFFVGGLLLMLRVNEKAGREAAVRGA